MRPYSKPRVEAAIPEWWIPIWPHLTSGKQLELCQKIIMLRWRFGVKPRVLRFEEVA